MCTTSATNAPDSREEGGKEMPTKNGDNPAPVRDNKKFSDKEIEKIRKIRTLMFTNRKVRVYASVIVSLRRVSPSPCKFLTMFYIMTY